MFVAPGDTAIVKVTLDISASRGEWQSVPPMRPKEFLSNMATQKECNVRLASLKFTVSGCAQITEMRECAKYPGTSASAIRARRILHLISAAAATFYSCTACARGLMSTVERHSSALVGRRLKLPVNIGGFQPPPTPRVVSASREQ